MELRWRSWVLGALFISLLFGGFGGSGCLGFAVNRRPKNVQVSLRAKWAGTSLLLESGSLGYLEQPELFEFDHVYLASSIISPVAILYGAIGTECFKDFHIILAEASKQGKIKYVVRPVLPPRCQAVSSYCSAVGSSDAVNLGGYGVELALKNMEYKAMDDTMIKEDLGHQTVQRIVHASDPLQSMQEINQNFPSIVSSLSRMKLNDSIKDEILANQRMVPPGKSLVALNGALINIEDIDLYLLMDLVQQELSFADHFSKLKLPLSAIQKLLSAAPPSESNAFRIDFRSGHVHYLNNLEEDAMYKRWRSNINEILMPVFPGQLRYIRKNLFHAVYTIDMILSLHQSSIPMRFGIILYSSKLVKMIEENGGHLPSSAVQDDKKRTEDVSSLIIRLFLYVKENYDTQLAFQFLGNVNKLWNSGDDFGEENLEAHHVEGAFVDSLLSKAKSPPHDTLLKLEKELTYKEEADGSSLFVFKLGLSRLECCLLMNGLVYEANQEASINAMNEELPRIQEQVYYGHINSKTDVLEKFLSENGYRRYNPQIGGSKRARVAMLLYSTVGASSTASHFVKAFDTAVSGFLHGQLGLEYGSNAVITNGRIFILKDGSPFLSDDLSLLESVEYELRIKYIYEIIDQVEWVDVDPDDLTSAVNLNTGNSSIHIDAVIDPLSPSGQKLSPLLRILWKCIRPSMRIVLNPVSSLADLPLKNYYRFVVPSLDDFSNVDYSVNGPKAFFSNMPLSKTLTMNLDVPEPWLVEPVVAIHDLDNILLENLGDLRTLQAVFELEALLLTGHCAEKDHDPPRGLQLILGTKRGPHLVDTLVMANLGYWQMKVSPGVWYLQLAPGRSADLYALKEGGAGSPGNRSAKLITINDLRGKLVHLEVAKKRGKEHEELLNASDDQLLEKRKEGQNSWNTNILKWASGMIGSGGLSRKGETRLVRYERFLKIMILSVLKNTQRPVKFWFIKNYLSPQFKDVIPHMAQEYGFQYELITYKWPTWLHKQKEKQRIIWAYKILFLDVIFPLSLRKVIFVDADQIVRADMGDLYDMDLKGRSLAYTPFCDNNKEMDGYRFWRQGFWKDHLQGKPYHISALYVVDLMKFRQTAAGDTLRVYYETLSKDPNSLSNLDQDLPNYAQHTVPIFSLPQEWLWCESWCGNATKAKAKTIDLCNNPMTKEPKLQGARRIVPEWVDLDAEARQLTARILGEEVDSNEPVTSTLPLPDGPQNNHKKDEL
ncbi:hypothetical protein C4D60_Mb05t03700 [Musa balbisiana]|uniref:UDP-glucose:glycoprotein glucosyltransferase n=1 Tax=Musa balbisiana TaxID=52838 RepID=A0A4V4H7W7_MUSBA|nr:hypothetical protein C4D60_Mb05t03700 [Musa balbisiana]